jgi:hypothetical protein
MPLAVLCVLSDILKTVDGEDVAGLVLLDFPPIFTLLIMTFCYVALINHMASTV